MKVLFFASLRETLDCAELTIPTDGERLTTTALLELLIRRGGDEWRDALMQPNLVCAVNQAIVHGDQALAPDDEVAFFPPVTGG